MTEEILPKKPRFEGKMFPIAYDPSLEQWLVFSDGGWRQNQEDRDYFLEHNKAAMLHPLNREFLDVEDGAMVDRRLASLKRARSDNV